MLLNSDSNAPGIHPSILDSVDIAGLPERTKTAVLYGDGAVFSRNRHIKEEAKDLAGTFL